MQHIQTLRLHPGARARRVNLGPTLAVIVTIGLALPIMIGLILGMAVYTGIAPQFDQSIPVYAEHVLVIHYGPRPTCASIPNPPQHDCFQPGSARREFTVDYITPHGARALVWLRLPAL